MYLLAAGDYSWLAHLGIGEIVAIGLVISFVLFIKVILPKIVKSKVEKEELLLKQDIKIHDLKIEQEIKDKEEEFRKKQADRDQLLEEINRIVNTVDERTIKFEENFKKNNNDIENINKTLDINAKLIHDAYRQSLRNDIYGDKCPILDRLIAFKKYLLLGGNGSTIKYAKKELIPQNYELWLSVIDKEDEFETEDNINYEYYQETIKELNKEIEELLRKK